MIVGSCSSIATHLSSSLAGVMSDIVHAIQWLASMYFTRFYVRFCLARYMPLPSPVQTLQHTRQFVMTIKFDDRVVCT